MNNQTLEDKLLDLDLEFLHGVPVNLNREMVEQIKQVFKDEGYTKKHHILYGTKYPDPRPCTKNSHFIEHEQSDCGCGYTKGMSK